MIELVIVVFGGGGILVFYLNKWIMRKINGKSDTIWWIWQFVKLITIFPYMLGLVYLYFWIVKFLIG